MRIADPRVSAPQLPLWPEAPGALPVSVRHSHRARRVAVRISVGGLVELVVPRGVSERRAWAFFETRAEWVRHHVERRRAQAPVETPFPPREVHLPLTGERWRVFLAGGAGRPRLVEAPGVLELRGQGESAHLRRCLQAWVKRRAEAVLKPLLDAESARHGLLYRTLSVRNQRTRWGSCSTRGQISLNLALLFQPPEVVRYLLCHELAHTRHMNHSARFWQLVEQCEPRWRVLDAELTTGWRHVPAWLRERQ